MKAILFVSLILTGIAQAETNQGAEALSKASRAGDVKTLRNLLAAGADPDSPDRYGHTPLYYAAEFGQSGAVELLLADHADPNTRLRGNPWDGDAPATPLQYAAELGNRQVAENLLAAGARVNEAGASGRTALHFANGHLELLALLISKGGEVNARDRDGESPLDEAAWFGSLDTAALLLAHGARLNEPEPGTGATPINEAAYKGHTELVRYMLRLGADIDMPDNQRRTPLDNAIRMGKENAAVLLIQAEGEARRTPEFLGRVMDAATPKDEALVVETVLGKGISPNAVLPSGSTPLDVAAFSGASKTVDVLLQHQADPNQTGRNGNLPLADASLKGFDGIATALLEHGAEVDRTSVSGSTALYSATSFGKGKLVQLLLKRGANPNVCGANQKSAYEAALENGFREIADDLARAGGSKRCAQR